MKLNWVSTQPSFSSKAIVFSVRGKRFRNRETKSYYIQGVSNSTSVLPQRNKKDNPISQMGRGRVLFKAKILFFEIPEIFFSKISSEIMQFLEIFY